ncbi:LOW QUALITY PROTEIN: probable folate-biopterin transporter 2 [Dioscorea cayenensis subsp. rotundata]|uniref:LOW QUALITY PROTEIN: probable folate-biopterin transporter 2 n=1 Tax=Dioscorea cayennensis subsp. rotundata TaxID=55577 RepID=A0AB40CQJ6_DIOCR|nr:LOW QUALITY PROTEIN: probable folate-biopterin transporter 2 [Dioscorea cayenensis subsp. rotundata]
MENHKENEEEKEIEEKKLMSWFRVLAKEMHWSFVFGVVSVNGISQGMGGAVYKVATDYYWKDVQRVQPSAAQIYQGITSLPWIVKPLWGLMTDVLPLGGYRRRPYFMLAGLLGVVSMLMLSLHRDLGVVLALLALTAGSTGVAMADVTIDACVAQNSINHPSLAADMQSLCGFSSSLGGLIGFSISGLLLHTCGSQGVLGLLSLPFALVFSVGLVLKELRRPNFMYKQVYGKLQEANQTMWTTMKCPNVWRPCVYMYISLALNLSIHQGMFYWYTDPNSGPSFSQETVGFIFSVGSVGSLIGVLIYQNILKDYPFRTLLFWAQLLSSFSGMLDLILVSRLNLKLGIPDYFFIVIDESISQMISRIKWMPILVLSSKLCPSGIEGTFFALLMAIDHIGMLTGSWGGGLLLHALKVTRTQFGNLWVAILVRSLIRMLPLALIYLVPNSDQMSRILPEGFLMENGILRTLEAEVDEAERLVVVPLVYNKT